MRGIYLRILASVSSWPCLLLLSMTMFTPAVATSKGGTGLIVHAIPSADGHEAWVWANVVRGIDIPTSGVLCESVSRNCRTMTCILSGCIGTLTGLPIETIVEGQILVTIIVSPTQTLESGPLPFVRAFIPASQLVSLVSSDNLLELTIFPNSLPADTYIFVLATSTPPGALPTAHRLIAPPYSIRASGALVLNDNPMSLRLSYDSLGLANATPHNLSIFAWDPASQIWLEKGGTLFTDQNHLSIPTRRFTTYALLEVPAWRDTFADTSGLSMANDTSPTPTGGLILSSNALSGTATSIPITPTTTIASWGHLVFTATTSTTTAVTVDVLSPEGKLLRANVTSGESLVTIDPATYPSLRLHSTLSTQVPGESPVLGEWRITWLPAPSYSIFLPIVVH